MTSDVEAGIGENRGLLYGDGLFETLRVEDGRALFLERHRQRFRQSAGALGFPPGVVEEAQRQMGARQQGTGLWRVTAIRPGEGVFGGGQGGVFCRWRELSGGAAGGARVMILAGAYLPGDRLAEHKTTSWLRSVEARRKAELAGFDEALLVADDGRVGEGAAANVFLRVDGVWHTPVVRGILPGVVRGALLDAARAEAGVDVKESVVTGAMLARSEAMALTSTGRLVTAVTELDGRGLDAAPVAELRSLLGRLL